VAHARSRTVLFVFFAAILTAGFASIFAAAGAGLALISAAFFAGFTGDSTGAESGEGQNGQ